MILKFCEGCMEAGMLHPGPIHNALFQAGHLSSSLIMQVEHSRDVLPLPPFPLLQSAHLHVTGRTPFVQLSTIL
jgi:hypothetical protein